MTSQSPQQHTSPTDFDGWWNTSEDWVEEPNQRRNGWSGMIRLRIGSQTFYVKKQCNHLFHSPSHPFGRPTVSREYENILHLKALGLRIPEPVFHGTRRTRQGFEGLLVTKELTGFSALSDQTAISAQARETLAKETGRALGIMHKVHLQHSCLYDKHIMVRWNGNEPEIALIDLEKLRQPILPWRAAKHDINQLQRHQHIWSKSEWKILLDAHSASAGSAHSGDENAQ